MKLLLERVTDIRVNEILHTLGCTTRKNANRFTFDEKRNVIEDSSNDGILRFMVITEDAREEVPSQRF